MNDEDDSLPDWTWPYTDCFTGPYWSDGKFQASVANGDCVPKSKLDRCSKKHDNTVHGITDLDILDQSDIDYARCAFAIRSWPARAIGTLPYLFNKQPRNAERLANLVGLGGRSKMGNTNKNGQRLRGSTYLGMDLMKNTKVTRTAQPTLPPISEVYTGNGNENIVCYAPDESVPNAPYVNTVSTSTPIDIPNSGNRDKDTFYEAVGPGAFAPFMRASKFFGKKKRKHAKRNRVYIN